MRHGYAAGALPRLLAVLDRDGEEARVVGGAVRNASARRAGRTKSMSRPRLCRTRSCAACTAAGFKAVPTGIAHGTVTVVVDGHPFEVTTLRQDVETYGRHAKVAFGRDWQRRRRTARLHHQCAVRDARRRGLRLCRRACRSGRATVRFIGEPRARIEEDYLRILRFFRFHAAYGARRARSLTVLRACIRRPRAGSSSSRANACAWN